MTECPVDILTLDDERRRESDDALVSLLAEHASFHQAFAEGSCRSRLRFELDSHEEPLTPSRVGTLQAE